MKRARAPIPEGTGRASRCASWKQEICATRSLAAVRVVAALVWVAAMAPAAALDAATRRAAAWVAFDLVVDLRNLPRRYSCEDISQKTRDVLLAVGAHPEYVLTHRCEQALGTQSRSPEVHVRFSLLEALDEPRERTSGLSVVRKTVELQPGHPPSLGASDCQLLREIKGALLAVLPVQIVNYRLACEAPGRALPPFRISVSAWTPVQTSRLAAGAPGTPAGVAIRKGPPL